MVAVGGLVEDTDYTSALNRVLAVLGNGSGQSGYGQVVTAKANHPNVSANDELIDKNQWNDLIADLNVCRRHQVNQDLISWTIDTGDIIGADASATSVTRNVDGTFSLVSPNNAEGINDLIGSITTIETDADQVATGQFTLGGNRSFVSSTRFSPWGGDGDPDDNIWCELDVDFQGGYTTYNTSGSLTATGDDARRHFFNAGGDIRITFSSTSLATKDANWSAMFSNVTVIFGKNSTTANSGLARDGLTDVDGGGIDSAVGNFQLSTAYQTIYRKFGSGVYAANFVQVRAKRVNNNIIRFRIDFNDAAEGNPNFDERLLLPSGSSMSAGLHLKRPSGSYVSLPEPASAVVVDFQDT